MAHAFNLTDGEDGADNLLFVNHGGLRFSEESDRRGIVGTRYTFVGGLFDFDGDGDIDLLEVNDYGRNVLWDNDGAGRFASLPDHPLGRSRNFSMSLSVADYDNSGRWTAYVANMYSYAGNRVLAVVDPAISDDFASLARLAAGNELFVQSAPGAATWHEQARALGAHEGGWAWGSVFYDLDNDGDLDLYVANGNTSHHDARAPDY